MTKRRFSKTAMLEHLREQMANVQKRWDFDPANGTAQLGTDMCPAPLDKTIAYGKYILLEQMIEDIEGGYVG